MKRSPSLARGQEGKPPAAAGAEDEFEPCLVKCPPERHIALAFTEIANELSKNGAAIQDREQYRLVCSLIECMYAQEFLTMRRNIKHNFLMFNVGAKGQSLPAKVGKSLPSKVDLDNKEMLVLHDLTQMLIAARFHIMTQDEWALALTEDFNFNLPVEVNWEYFDGRFLERFWKSSQERAETRTVLSPIAEKILVFHRGVGQATASGMFISEKLDLLIEYLVADPLHKVWDYMKEQVPILKPKDKFLVTDGLKTSRSGAIRRKTAEGLMPLEEDEAQGIPSQSGVTEPVPEDAELKSKFSVAESEVTDARTNSVTSKAGLTAGLEHKNARLVERKTLRRVMPTTTHVISNFLNVINIQEPSYKEVVVVYRSSNQGRSSDAQKDKNVLGAGVDHATRLKQILSRRNVHVKYFHDIPMADIEAVFPDKKVFPKRITQINMVVQAVLIFFGMFWSTWQAGALALTLSTMWNILSVPLGRVYQLRMAAQYERSLVVQNMVNILYDKLDDAQDGVLSMLLEDMSEQQLKEAVLAYTLLLASEESMSQSALDDLCENYLEETFDCRIDFAVEDALPQLVKWGLVKHNPRTDMYEAVPISGAHDQLKKRWDSVYEAISKPPAEKQQPLYNLLPGGEEELIRSGAKQGGVSERLRVSMPGNYSFSGLEAIREVDNHGDLTPGTRVEIGLTESGNLAFKKKSRGPIHKVSKTFKNMFSDGKPKRSSQSMSESPRATPPSYSNHTPFVAVSAK